MATRGVIAIPQGDGWKGRYHHNDSYPTGLGVTLFKAYHETFNRDVSAMIGRLVVEETVGWSTINGFNLALPTTYTEYDDMPRYTDADDAESYGKKMREFYASTGPQGFSARGETGDEWRTHASDNFDIEWVYVLSRNGMTVLRGEEPAGFVAWDEEPNWAQVECGEHFEHCIHLVWAHEDVLGPIPDDCRRLGTRQYLGHEPLTVRDAIGARIKGREYELTGSGHSESRRGYRYVWIAGTKAAGNGRRSQHAVYALDGDGEAVTLPGVELLYPTVPA